MTGNEQAIKGVRRAYGIRTSYCGYLIVLILAISTNSFSQSETIRELKNQIEFSDHDTSRSRALYLLTYEFLDFSLDSALYYARQNLILINNSIYPKFQVTALSGVGTTFMYMSVFDSAQYYMEKALTITKEHDLPNQASALYTNFGVLYKRQGLYDQAIQSYIDGLIVDEENGHLYGLIVKKLNIANLYSLLGDINRSLTYATEALESCQDLDHSDKPKLQGLLLNNIGSLYTEQLDFDRALSKFQEALAVNTAADNQNEMSRNLHNLGAIYEKMDSTEKGLPMLLEAFKIRRRVGDKIGMTESHMQLGSSYGKLGAIDSSNYHFAEAIKLAKSIGNHALTSETYLAISNNDIERGNFEEALNHYQLSVAYQDSIDNEYDREAYLEMESKYQAAQKDAKISQQSLVINRRTSQRNKYLFGVLVLVLLVAFIFYRNKHNRDFANERIKTLEQQQKLLAIDYMVQGQEQERKRIARDLHDGLGGLLSSASLQMQSIQKEIDKLGEMQLFSKAEQMIDNACKEVRRIAHDMMPGALIDLGLIEAIDDLADKIRLKGNLQVDVIVDFDEVNLTEVQSVNLYRMVQEFCNNTLRHAHARKLTLLFGEEKGMLIVDLSDDGVGYNVNDPNITLGIGRRSIESRVKYLAGSLQDLTLKGSGCRYLIKVPLDQDSSHT
jgi:signal transduction histidine kinase